MMPLPFLREGVRGKAVPSQRIYHHRHRLGESSSSSSAATSSLPVLKAQDLAAARQQGKLWIIIHGLILDVTDFAKKHPGGEHMLVLMAGKDCTDAFENFHYEHVARHMLAPLVIARFVDESSSPTPPLHVLAFRELRQELLRRGMFQVDPTYYRQLHLRLGSIFGLAMVWSLMCQSRACHMLGALAIALFWQQVAGYGHDLGHGSVTKWLRHDHWFGSTFGCALTGISTTWWRHNHNTHHVFPNSVNHDPDIQHLPFLAISENITTKESFWSTYYQKWFHMGHLERILVGYQHWTFVPLMMVARFNLYAQSILFLSNPKRATSFRLQECCGITIFTLWYLGVALCMTTWWETMAWILVSHACSGILHVQIVLSHWAMETYRATENEEEEEEKDRQTPAGGDNNDWYTLQLQTTLDLDCPPYLDWIHLGLQFQVTHHIFPTLPRSRLREATKLVQQVCQKHGLRYHCVTFRTALDYTLQTLTQTAASARDLSTSKNHSSMLLQSHLLELWNARG